MAQNKKDEKKGIKGTTPIGIAVFPRLTTPDTKFEADGVYSLKLKLTEEAAAPLIELIDNMIEEEFKAALAEAKPAQKARMKKADPSYSREYDTEGNPTGYILFNFKMKASGISKKTGKQWTRKPVIFDSKGRPITDPAFNIWGGSRVRVGYELKPFTSNVGSGVSHRLEAVQIIELHDGNSKDAAAYGFDAVDGYDVAYQPTMQDYDSAPSGEETPLDTDF